MSTVSQLAVRLPPIGLASIAAVLREAGHSVRIMDANLSPRVSNQEWAERVITQNPDFVGFSAITPTFLNAWDICRRIKQKSDAIRTVFGGVHVSWGRDRILRDFDSIDYVLAGEGEYTFLQLVEGTRPEEIEGCVFRSGTDTRSGPEQTNLCTMDDLPFPAYDLIENFPKRYYMPLFSYPKHPGAGIVSSRGCVYNCSYCDRSVFRKSFRWNSPEYTFELIKKLNTDFGIRHIMFYDDLFTLNRKRVARLCGLLRNTGPKMSFNCIVRIGHIDEDLIRELKSAGCWMVHVGIESGDQEILDGHKEGLRLADIERDVHRLHEEGLWVKGLFMTGFPGETENSIRRTIQFARALPLKDINVTAFTPYPGAPIYQDIHSQGEFTENWDRMDCMDFVFVNKEIGSREKLEAYQRRFISEFYQRPFMRKVYRKMVVQSPHSWWRLLSGAPQFAKYALKLNR